jgi:hypothetical protein
MSRSENSKGAKAMRTFTIDAANNIAVSASTKQPKVSGAELFRTEKQLSAVAAKWPSSRLVELWNRLPGVQHVRKFKDKQVAIGRIWDQIQQLQFPELPVPDDKGKRQPSGRNTGTRLGRNVQSGIPGTRGVSKTCQLLELLKRPKGATIHELTAAVGWQPHSVRGFLSGSVTRKMKLKLQSRKRKDGVRVYELSS